MSVVFWSFAVGLLHLKKPADAYADLNAAASHLLKHKTLFQTKNRPSLDQLANAQTDADDGALLRAHVALPEAPPDGPLPVLLLLHEFFGLNESILDKSQLLADDLGCVVIAPDTFRGVTTSFIPRAIWLALTAPQARVNADLDAWLRWAASAELGRVAGVLADPKRVAVMGFCYGGGKAIRYTTQARPDAATVVWYGNPLTDVEELGRLRAPVCAVFGCDDPQIPQPLVNRFRGALELADVEHEVMSYYGAGHAFWSSVQQVRDEEMPVIAGYRLTKNFLEGFYAGKESFAKKRAFLEFQLRESELEEGGGEAAAEGE